MGFAECKQRRDGELMVVERRAYSSGSPGGLSEMISGTGGAINLAQGYRQQAKSREAMRHFKGWVWSATTLIAKRCAGQPWMAGHYEESPPDAGKRPGRLGIKRYMRYDKGLIPRLQRKAPQHAEVEPDQNHRVLWDLDRPNPQQGKFELVYFSVLNLLLTGEWFWVGGIKEADDDTDAEDDRQVGEMEVWAVPSAWMSRDEETGGWKMQTGIGAEEIKLPKENVARGYFPDPSDPKGCGSPLASCIQAVRIDEYILSSQEQSFARGIDPKIALVVGSQPGPDGGKGTRPRLVGAQRRQMIRAIRQVWSQTVNAGDPAILDGLIEDIKKLQFAPNEMDWQNSGKIIKDRIMQTFGVNPITLGEVTPANKAQAVVAETNLCTNALNPIIENLSCAASEFFTPFYDDGSKLAVWLEKAIPKDDEREDRQWSDARKNGDVTGEEVRQRLGLEAKEEAERSVLLSNPQAMTTVANIAAQVSGGTLEREAAVAIIAEFLQIAPEVAEKMIPEQGEPPAAQPEAKPLGGSDGKNSAAMRSPWSIRAVSLKSFRGKIAREFVKSAHAAQADRLERSMAAPIAKWVSDSVDHAMAGIFGAQWLPRPTEAKAQADALLAAHFSVDRWTGELAKLLGKPSSRAFVEGAIAEHRMAQAALRRRNRDKATAGEFASEVTGEVWFDVDIPEWIISAARAFLDAAFNQPYWLEVAQTTLNDMAIALGNAIFEGKSIPQIRDALIEQFGSAYGKARATLIARTEVGGALNAGAIASIKHTYEGTDLKPTKVWQSVLGPTTREEHADADGQEVPVDDKFTVGGELCDHPGDVSLSIGNRANCQCFCTAGLVGAELSDEDAQRIEESIEE